MISRDPQDPTLQAEDILTDRGSIEFLATRLRGGELSGKVVMAEVDGRVVVALGDSSILHLHIINKALRELGLKPVDSESRGGNLEVRIPDGVTVGGGYFGSTAGEIFIDGESSSFGPLKDGAFSQPTEKVVAGHIKHLVQVINSK